MKTLRTNKNGNITLTKMIGSGTEGAVYEIKGKETIVAKVFHQKPSDSALEEKLQSMLNHPPSKIKNSTFRIAWPTDLIYQGPPGTQIVGFIMPRINTEQFQEIGVYLNPARRRMRTDNRTKGFSYLHLLNLANNLAVCVSNIHENGHVIGDINSKNILANDRGQIAVIDTDSFQITDQHTQKIHHCNVGSPEYTPPHLQGIKFSSVDRTDQDDLFALAVMIYQILIQGHHPYSGVPAHTKGRRKPIPTTITEKIKIGTFVHLDEPKMLQIATQSSTAIWKRLPLKRQFKRAFTRSDQRQSARKWADDIEKIAQRVKICPKNSQHYYFGQGCTWCHYKTLTKVEPFPSPSTNNKQNKQRYIT